MTHQEKTGRLASGERTVDVEQLGVAYGSQVAVDGLTFHVNRGEVLALLGPNGAGKTTTVSVLATLRRPTSGRARVAGYDVVGDAHRVRAAIAVTGQDTAVDARLTGRENARLLARLAHVPRRRLTAVVDEALERLGLAEAADRRVATWSGGTRRRLDLALSLMREPAVLLLDEPTTGLDPHARQEVWQLVREAAGRGTTVVLTTQYLEEADRLADRIAVVDHGRLVALGPAADLKRRVGQAHLEVRTPDGRLRRFATDGTVADAGRLLAQLDVPGDARWRLHEPTLDDVFLTLTGHATQEVSA